MSEQAQDTAVIDPAVETKETTGTPAATPAAGTESTPTPEAKPRKSNQEWAAERIRIRNAELKAENAVYKRMLENGGQASQSASASGGDPEPIPGSEPAQQPTQQPAQSQQTDAEDWAIKVAEAAAKHEDWDETMEVASVITLPPVCVKALQKSTDGAELMYHLGKNPEDAERIMALPPALALRELFALRSKFAASSGERKASGAPAPVKPVKTGSAPAEDRRLTGTMEEFRAAERAKFEAKHGRRTT